LKKNFTYNQYLLIFYFLLALLLADRLLHLHLFSFQYADSDQTIMWLGAIEMLQGNFYEPAFYGQAYNTMFEAVLAVPLVAIGIPVYKALPIITTLLAIFPFILFAFITKNCNKIAALIFLAIPLLLPVEYTLITQLPRGFVTGIFSASIAVAFLVFNDNWTKKRLLLSGVFGGMALVLNPNSILLLLPVYLYVFIKTETKLQMVFSLFLGALPALFWQIFVLWFYAEHPHYLQHTMDNKTVNINHFFSSISLFHQLFYGLFPFLIFAGAGIIPALLFVSYRLKKKDKKAAMLSVLAVVVFIFITFFTSKINDGTASIFFPYCRMFLALPLVIGVGLYFLFKEVNINTKPLYLFLSITGLATLIKFASINDRIGWNLHNNSGFVEVFKIDDFKLKHRQIQNIADSLKLTTLVINEKNDALNYGLMALSESRIKTISLSYERKGWLVAEEMKKAGNAPYLLWCEDEKVLQTTGLLTEKVSAQFPLYKVITAKNPILFFTNQVLRNKRSIKKI
jgi:hypothetical protein